MNAKQLFLFLLLALSLSGLKAQDSSKVRFYVRAGDVYYIRHNDRVLPLSNVQMLPPGEQRIEIWSPKYRMFDTTISVPSNDSINVVAKLKLDGDFRTYRYQQENYKRQRFWMGSAPATLFCLSTITTLALYSPLRNSNEERVKENFSQEFGAVDVSSGGGRRFALNSTLMITSVTAQVVGAIWFLALRPKLKSLEKPTYRQQNPFTLDYFEITYNQQHQVPQAGMTFKF